jgi:DNA polymerase-3 subunit epsilon
MTDLQARRMAIQQAKAEVAREPVYLDTETTGLDPLAEIVEICIVDHAGQVLIDSLVKPTGRIPRDASNVHHITDEMVKAAPTWAELWPSVAAALKDRRVAIYNADYDVRLMQQSHRLHSMEWRWRSDAFVCVMQLYAKFYGEWIPRYRSYRLHSLEAAARQCRLGLPNAHRARADALLARALLQYMASRDK